MDPGPAGLPPAGGRPGLRREPETDVEPVETDDLGLGGAALDVGVGHRPSNDGRGRRADVGSRGLRHPVLRPQAREPGGEPVVVVLRKRLTTGLSELVVEVVVLVDVVLVESSLLQYLDRRV